MSLLNYWGDRNDVQNPDSFRLDRPPHEYMHYGYGVHTCFGEYINQVQIPGILLPLLKQKNLRRAEGDAGKLQMQGAFPTHLNIEFDV